MIATTSLVSVLNAKTYKLPVDSLINEFINDSGQVTEITDKQRKDYETHEYKCYDKVYIPGSVPMKRSNFVDFNGHMVRIPDREFKLFLEFVVELKKKKGGWVTKQTDAGKYQSFSNLRKTIEGSLLEKKGIDFIQCDGSKRYRISTHPDFVTYNRKALLKHPDSTVQELAKQLRK